MRDSKYLLPDNQENHPRDQILAKEASSLCRIYTPRSERCARSAERGRGTHHAAGAPSAQQGSLTREFIKILIDGKIDLPIVDAGIAVRRRLCEAMEMRARQAIMANILAIATAGDIPAMAEVQAGD